MSTPQESSGLTRFVPRLVLVLGLASLPFLVHPWFDARSDAAMYLLCTKSLLAGEGYSYLGEAFAVRPPGFSLLLAPFVAAFGLDYTILNGFVALSGLALCVLLFVHVRARASLAIALAVAVALHLNPGFRALSNQVMSDVPGLALGLACLVFERRARSARSRFLLGLAIGASALVRTFNVLLVPAIVLSAALRRERLDPRGTALLVLGAVLCIVPWTVRNATIERTSPAEETYLYSYGTALLHEDPGDPASARVPVAELFRRIPTHGKQLLATLGERLRGPGTTGERYAQGRASVALGVVVFLALLCVAVRRREPADVFALLAVGVVVTHFTFNGRLVLPVFVLALAALGEGLEWGCQSLAGDSRGTVVAVMLVLLLGAIDFQPRQDWARIEREHTRREALVERLEEEPVTTVCAAPVGWELALSAGRPVHSVQPALVRSRVAGARRIFEKHGVTLYVFDGENRLHRDWWKLLGRRYAVSEEVAGWKLVPVK